MRQQVATEIRDRLPENYCASVIWHVAQRHHLTLKQGDDFIKRCEDAIEEHVLMIGAYNTERAHKMVHLLDEGLAMLVVVCAEAFVSNLVTGRLDAEIQSIWIQAAA